MLESAAFIALGMQPDSQAHLDSKPVCEISRGYVLQTIVEALGKNLHLSSKVTKKRHTMSP